MISIEITDTTPANMLRAIKAACDELLGNSTQSIAAAVEAVKLDEQVRRTPEELAAVLSGNVVIPTAEEQNPEVAKAWQEAQDVKDAVVADSEELDSAGQSWNADQHSSSKAKISDGTWKKRRNAAPPELPPAPPVPPLPPADTMKRIFALITAQVCTLNDVLAAAAEHGIKDLGQNGLTGASAEVQLAVLRKLEGA